MGPMGPWAPWAPWSPMGPHGAQCSQFSNFWKTFFRKSTQKSKMTTFGVKTKVVRTEILHILVPIPSRGDLYLTISRVSIILTNLGFLVQFPMCVFF